MATSSPNMASEPLTSSETHGREAKLTDNFIDDIRGAVEFFVSTLSKIAEHHKRPEEYVWLLGGLGGFKKVTQGSTTPFGAFCSKKLQEINAEKKIGERTTLPEFLKSYSNSQKWKDEYGACDKDELLDDYREAKKAKEAATMRGGSVSISKAVNAKLQSIVAYCEELNNSFGTKIALFFSRGSISHSYNPGAFVTEGAEKWLENAQIGRNTPKNISVQLEGFVTSGCSEQMEETKKPEENAWSIQQNTRTVCRIMIKNGLEEILRKKGVSYISFKMNYTNYEQKIVEHFGVALDGWPLDGHICNPGDLGCKDMAMLRDALENGACKWTLLTPEELSARKAANQQSAVNDNGPPQEQQPCDVVLTGSGSGGDNVDMDVDTA